MLSRSQARAFFIIFTAGFSLVFLGLTVDTLMALPERSHADAITPQVARGKALWEDNNCMGCHTILGEGAYYAPELTRVYERRGPIWIKTFIRDPEAMFPNERRMVKYDFSEEDLDALVAFFQWVGQIDTNGFPAEPDLKALAANAPPAANTATGDPHAGAPPIFSALCTACHAVGGKGGVVGPALDGVGTRYTAESLDAWLKDPQAVKPGTKMPNLGLSEPDRKALNDWLMNLK